jgi:DNA invertase Pin-like site-specific DNA recombinase
MTTRSPSPSPAVALLYQRVSTGHQEISEAAQEAAAASYAAGLTGGNRMVFADPDVSGSVPFAERHGGRALLEALRKNTAAGVRCLIVTIKQERLGRDTPDVINTVRHFWNVGAELHFPAEGGCFPRSPQNELLLGVKASAAQYDLNQIRDRTRIAIGHMRTIGRRTGSAAYGWDFEDTDQTNPKTGRVIQRLVRNEKEQRILGEMRTMRAAGHSYSAIARWLNDRGIPTKRAGELVKKRRFTTDADGKRVAVKGDAGLYSVPTTGEWTHAAVQSVLENKLNAPAVSVISNQ